jgi:hypothetical protein
MRFSSDRLRVGHITRRARQVVWAAPVSVLAAACLVSIVWGATAAGSILRGDPGRSAQPSWVRQFPLWMDVPTSAFAVLGEGTVRQTRWGIYAFRGTGQRAGQSPCLEDATLYYGGGSGVGASFHSGMACGSLAPPAITPLTTESVVTAQKGLNAPIVSDTVFGTTLASSVSKVKLQLRPGPTQTRQTRLLSASQARKAHLSPFRYVVFGVARKACMSRITGFDVLGAQLFESPPEATCR